MGRSSVRLKGDERRRQILQVALGLFAERGYHKTTTAAIAGAAGVTEPVLYRHFASKKEMFLTLVREVQSESERQWQSICEDSAEPVERLRRLIGSDGNGSRIHGMMVWRSMLETGDEDVSNLARELLDSRFRVLQGAVDDAKEAGGLRPEADEYALSLHLLNLEMGSLVTDQVLGDQAGTALREAVWHALEPWLTESASAGGTSAL